MFRVRPYHAIDFYKADHRTQYPEGTGLVYSNFTPRASKHAKVGADFDNKVVVFGIQAFCLAFQELWDKEFFHKPAEEVISYYKRRMDTSLGENAIKVDAMLNLHKLGYLPLEIKALPEGSLCPIKVPMITVKNTDKEFFWLVNYIESVMSCCLWKFMTSATIARQYRLLLDAACARTGGTPGFVPFQGHDFSFRGMSGTDDAVMSGSGHLLSFQGTDTVLAIDFLEDYYGADSSKELIGGSVVATEHSVMCMGGKEEELGTFRRLMGLYPTGILSVVSDTWDFWGVVTTTLPIIKDEVLSRDGKLVIRPDSGDPVRIVAGYEPHELVSLHGREYHAYSDGSLVTGEPLSRHEVLGAVRCLWETFGGTTNEKGFKTLDQHIGLIYGDSITLDIAKEILDRLAVAGFSSDNIVFGIGSYTYEYVTRDTFGFAMKATYGEVDGVGREIFKSPKTDSGMKKSAKGLLRVDEVDGALVLSDSVSWEEESGGALGTVFINGSMSKLQTLSEIRGRLLRHNK